MRRKTWTLAAAAILVAVVATSGVAVISSAKPVQVQITTAGAKNAPIVPVTALVGNSRGGFAVEVVRDGGRRELVTVQPSLFDDADGLVQVEGDLRKGDRVVVPSP